MCFAPVDDHNKHRVPVGVQMHRYGSSVIVQFSRKHSIFKIFARESGGGRKRDRLLENEEGPEEINTGM